MGTSNPAAPEVTDAQVVARLEEAIETLEQVGADRGLLQGDWRPLWVVDFPLCAWDVAGKRWSALHHPFTAPNSPDADALKRDPGKAGSRAYDIVLNGNEIGGGSIRIHDTHMQSAVFDILGIGPEEAETSRAS